jgi:small glutamine-rich tetratricopeptide repeat-containing protein alpha
MSDKSKALANSLLDSLKTDISSGKLDTTQESDINSLISSLSSFISLSSASSTGPTKEDLERAEQYKNDGNSALSSDNHIEAISCYKRAIDIIPDNAIYHANLSAAYLTAKMADKAKKSAQTAIDLDPKYAKGYIRLANAETAAGNKDQAVKALKRGLEINPNNSSLESQLKSLSEEVVSKPAAASSSTPGSSSPLGNMPGGLAGLMNNPELMKMAQQMMANGNFAELMKSPQVAELMNNPQQIAEMMKNMKKPQ